MSDFCDGRIEKSRLYALCKKVYSLEILFLKFFQGYFLVKALKFVHATKTGEFSWSLLSQVAGRHRYEFKGSLLIICFIFHFWSLPSIDEKKDGFPAFCQ
jgi:hypothetical protein